MQSIFTKCIFCRQPLPEKPEDCAKEHVIPKSVGGSLVIRDVCQSCNSKLGAEVDHLIFHDARIIDAINKLDLLEMRDQVAKIGKTTGIDTVSGAIVEGMVVSGKPKLVTREIEPEGIGVPEEKAKAILIKQVQRDGRLNWSKEKAAQHIEEIVWPKYKKMLSLIHI